VVVALGAVVVLNQRTSKTVSLPINAEEHSVVRIHVLTGHEFDLLLKDGKRIKGKLRVVTPIEATKKVVQLLNRSTNPKVILLEKQDHWWEIELKFKVDGNEMILSEWLIDNRLVWE
jgi:hypothetical protein